MDDVLICFSSPLLKSVTVQKEKLIQADVFT